MNKHYVLKNNMKVLMRNRGMSQKELAQQIGEREASVSDFVRLKRSTINIGLLQKIASALSVSSIDELISLQPILQNDQVKFEEWQTYSLTPSILYAYMTTQDALHFDTVEVSETGVLLHQRLDVTGWTEQDIEERFTSIRVPLDADATEDRLTKMLLTICRYRGGEVLAARYPSEQEALEMLDVLY